MSIMTRGGDAGKTTLIGGESVWKNDVRVEAYGTVDELNSCIGLAKNFVVVKNRKNLENIQQALFTVGSALADKKGDPRFSLDPKTIQWLEELIIPLDAKYVVKGFHLPGTSFGAGLLDLCRTVSRRAERQVVALSRQNDVSRGFFGNLIPFLNRLSDYFFLLSLEEGGRKAKKKPD